MYMHDNSIPNQARGRRVSRELVVLLLIVKTSFSMQVAHDSTMVHQSESVAAIPVISLDLLALYFALIMY
jgi:protein-S-isoprenylcysteine O-methyltransferase Ste14